MTSTESLEKLACSDWKAEMQATFKLIKEHDKTQEKDIANHNKKALEQEKQECVLDKQHAAEKKKAEVEVEKQLVQWHCEMAGLGKFAMEEMEKLKKKKLPQKAKAKRAAKSTRLQERNQEYFDFSMLSPNNPTPQAGPAPTPQKAKTHNDTVSTPEQPQLQPQPQLKQQPHPHP
ncbi:uncharacterized protein LACBIDRAFT_329914 [Laccaria bicolor S238N-H82]|uniref:Predicted protein n=1 Tax=Laccaria bicolor (strain S238N-H82 / ATCC MYA-4686) TaxID=486041 RepID=B0DJL7_LACBS|nr:uncharacterized protein LACBIDRAFT_329914 [Laccaria bicolor S238N-H82]EDR05141.1 predicted protein [Laccaria bicolor S238N-H82]|eukprot:XP_001884106.1 predicted protein [Laccaria bicolor S238N-H82]